jgi:hypothetical protein
MKDTVPHDVLGNKRTETKEKMDRMWMNRMELLPKKKLLKKAIFRRNISTSEGLYFAGQ